MITPVKNEIKHLPYVVDSVLNQTELPVLWVIIDGGSNDGSFECINEYAKKYSWIIPLHQAKYGRNAHESVSMAMRDAYTFTKYIAELKNINYDYIWTIDGDQILAYDVCAGVIQHCDDTIGVASGLVCGKDDVADTYPEGELPNKRVYSKKALEDIGGFPVAKYSFDTVILAKLRIKGYKVVSFSQYKITNLRSDSGIERDMWKSHVTFGRARWYLGYSMPLVIAGSGYLIMKGQFKKAIGIFYGYLADRFKGEEQIDDVDIKRHFGKDRLKEVLGLKV